MSESGGRMCLNCGYERTPGDIGSQEECPRCRAIYAKLEAREAARQQDRGRKAWTVVAVQEPAAMEPVRLARAIETVQGWCQGRWWQPRAVLLVYLIYVGYQHLLVRDYQSLFGGLNLAIHEAGHPLFGFFGELPGVAGGTLLELIAPLAAALMFLRQPDYFAISVCGVWLSTNLYYCAWYVSDARIQALPLVSLGGGDPIHDWNYLLSRFHLLNYDTGIGILFRLAGAVCMWASIAAAAVMLWQMARSWRGLEAS